VSAKRLTPDELRTTLKNLMEGLPRAFVDVDKIKDHIEALEDELYDYATNASEDEPREAP